MSVDPEKPATPTLRLETGPHDKPIVVVHGDPEVVVAFDSPFDLPVGSPSKNCSVVASFNVIVLSGF